MSTKKYLIEKNAQAFIDTKLCINCGTCRNLCPTEAIQEHQRLICRLCPDCENARSPIIFHLKSRDYSTTKACSIGCPLGIIPEGFVNLVAQGDIQGAYRLLTEKNPLASVCGEICSHPCQDVCKRGTLIDKPIHIRALQNYVLKNARTEELRFITKYDKRIAVVGGGPSGLTAAYDLSKKGYPVTIFEKTDSLGGAMNWGIPEFRLNKGLLREEIQRMEKAVKVVYNTEIGKDITVKGLLEDGYAYVILAVGASCGSKLPLEGSNLPLVYDAASLMRSLNAKKKVELGTKAVVIGGGSVALDTARLLRRLNLDVTALCLEDDEHVPAPAEEVLDAKEEGVPLITASTPVGIEYQDEVITGVKFRKVASLDTSNGQFKINEEPNSDFVVEANMVVFATGQKTDASKLEINLRRNGRINIDDTMKTDKANVYACGDGAADSVNVVQAMASGRKAALAVDDAVWGRSLKQRVEHTLYPSGDDEIIYPVRLERISPVEPEKRYEGKTQPTAVIDTSRLFENIESVSVSGKKVAVVGGGITGLRKAMAYRDAGNDVTVYERNFRLGGELAYYASDLRVNKKDLALVIEKATAGMEIVGGASVGYSIKLKDLASKYDVVFLAIGETGGVKEDILFNNAESVFDIISFMQKQGQGEYLKTLHDKLIVTGGDAMAVDAARVIAGLGKKAILVNPAESFTATDHEVELAINEGVDVYTGTSIDKINGHFIYISGVDLKTAEGKTVNTDAAGVIFGAVRIPQTQMFVKEGLAVDEKGYIITDENGRTNLEHVFAEKISDIVSEKPQKSKFMEAEKPKQEQHFTEGEEIYTEEQAVTEARRCMKCGFEKSDASKCIGCGICAKYCPANAITMIAVQEV